MEGFPSVATVLPNLCKAPILGSVKVVAVRATAWVVETVRPV